MAEKLGILCYDAELIQKIVEESGYTADYIKEEGEYEWLQRFAQIQKLRPILESLREKEVMTNICDIIDKSDILKRFEPINKKIRDHWKVKENKDKSKKAEIDYMEYDEYLNNCLIDCTIELINYERKYGENGNPLIWSSRMREIEFKYKKNEPKKLADFVCRNLKSFIKQKVGLIGREDDSTPSELINLERERRLKKIIRNYLKRRVEYHGSL